MQPDGTVVLTVVLDCAAGATVKAGSAADFFQAHAYHRITHDAAELLKSVNISQGEHCSGIPTLLQNMMLVFELHLALVRALLVLVFGIYGASAQCAAGYCESYN